MCDTSDRVVSIGRVEGSSILLVTMWNETLMDQILMTLVVFEFELISSCLCMTSVGSCNSVANIEYETHGMEWKEGEA